MDRGFLLAADRALDVSLRTGRYPLASRIASSQERTARKRLHTSGETPEALRDLSVSLNNVGDTAKAMGQWDKAEINFEESLQIRRKILERIGETPEALRDLSVSLDNVGDTAKAMGQWDKAGKNFKEGLAIGVLLFGSLPENVDYKGLADHFQNRLKELEKKG